MVNIIPQKAGITIRVFTKAYGMSPGRYHKAHFFSMICE